MTSFAGLPFESPIAPMLAKAASSVPHGGAGEWWYEPKWDGFRCIVFRSGDDVELSSRNERPFNRYFPELLGPLLARLPDRCVVDGEIVVPHVEGRGLDFDALLQRIHPAASRVRRLAEETPASFVAFDLLALGERSLLDSPLRDRRELLDEWFDGLSDGLSDGVSDGVGVAAGAGLGAVGSVYRCPSTLDHEVAQRWFVEFEGAGLDGVVAKRLADPYTPDKRTMVKVKHLRTADCVVAGYRIHKDGNGVGSLLLGLHDETGRLHHVGVTASFTAARRTELLHELAPLLDGALDGHPWREWAEAQAHAAGRLPGAQSRWNAGKDLSWVPVRVERVAEVTFGQLENGRFRHGSTFLRWRPDRDPAGCRYDQLEVADPVSFHDVVTGRV